MLMFHALKAYRLNIIQPKYLLLSGWYRHEWWKVEEDGLNCTVADREVVLQDTLAFLNYHSLTESESRNDIVSDTGIVRIFFNLMFFVL